MRPVSSLAIVAFASLAVQCGPAPEAAAPRPLPSAATSTTAPPSTMKSDLPPCSGCTDESAAVWRPIQAQLVAYNAHDVDAFLAPYDPSVVIRDFETTGVQMRGLDEMRARYAGVFKDDPERHAEVSSRIVSGDHVIDHERVVIGKEKRRLDTAVVYHVRAGKIDGVWFLPLHFEPGSAPVTAFVGATVVRPERSGDDAKIENAVVLVEGKRIRAVGRVSDVVVPPGAKVVDVHGKWISAGFIDSHVHFFQSGGIYARPDAIDLTRKVPYAEEQKRVHERLPTTLKLWLANGVTSVADDGGSFWNFRVRETANATRMAPRVKIAGPLLSTRDVPAVHRMDLDDPPIYPVKNVEEARALTRRELALEPDYVKVWFLHIKGDDLAAQEAIARAAGDEAHARGVRLMVHATTLDVAKAALRAGADILVHSVDDKPIDDEFLALARKRSVLYIPTLYVVRGYEEALSGTWTPTDAEKRAADPRILESLASIATMSAADLPKDFAARRAKMKDRVRLGFDVMAKNLIRVRDAQITIAFGTDAGNIGTVHGASIFREMALMLAAGMTPAEILRAATAGGAAVLGMQNELGIDAGRLADLVVLDADPTAAVLKGTEVRFVMKGGAMFAPDELLRDLK